MTAPAWLVALLAEHKKHINSKPWYMQPGATRMPKNFEARYRCKCGNWTGISGDFDTHVAETVWAEVKRRLEEVRIVNGHGHSVGLEAVVRTTVAAVETTR